MFERSEKDSEKETKTTPLPKAKWLLQKVDYLISAFVLQL